MRFGICKQLNKQQYLNTYFGRAAESGFSVLPVLNASTKYNGENNEDHKHKSRRG